MLRSLSLVAAVAVAVAGAATPALAGKKTTYFAVPVTPIEKARDLSVGDTLWECAPGGCKTTSGSGTSASVCAQAARKFGKLESFSVNEEAFAADKLAECNAKAD